MVVCPCKTLSYFIDQILIYIFRFMVYGQYRTAHRILTYNSMFT